MEEKLIEFNTAKLAKEKGFNIPTIQYYTPKGYSTESEDYMTERYAKSNWNDGVGSYPTSPEKVECSAPTQSLLQKWLREVHKISVLCHVWNGVFAHYCVIALIPGKQNIQTTIFGTYEEALEEGLFQALKLIKK